MLSAAEPIICGRVNFEPHRDDVPAGVPMNAMSCTGFREQRCGFYTRNTVGSARNTPDPANPNTHRTAPRPATENAAHAEYAPTIGELSTQPAYQTAAPTSSKPPT